MRAMLAAVFVFHGSQKLWGWFGGSGLAGFAGYLEKLGTPLPQAGAVAAGSAEFFGGLALLLGVATRLATIPMTFTMLVAAFVAHKGFSLAAGGNEYALTLAVMLIALGLLGPGRWTVPQAIRAVRGQPAHRATAPAC